MREPKIKRYASDTLMAAGLVVSIFLPGAVLAFAIMLANIAGSGW